MAIEAQDIPLPENQNLTKNNMSRIEEEWNIELKKSKPSLFAAFFRANSFIFPYIFIFSFFGYGLKTFMPFVLSGMVPSIVKGAHRALRAGSAVQGALIVM